MKGTQWMDIRSDRQKGLVGVQYMLDNRGRKKQKDEATNVLCGSQAYCLFALGNLLMQVEADLCAEVL